MSLGENTKLVPENIVYGETLEDYTLTVDYNLPPAKRAAQVPALGDPYPGDRYTAAQTAPWGYIVVQHDSATSHRTPDQGAYTTRVVYAKPKVPFASGITGLYEVYRRPETGRKGRYMGRRVFLAADANAESLALANLAELTPMFETGNWRYALLREKQIEHNWRVGIARIECVYDSYAEMGEVVHVNKGVLEIADSAEMVWNRCVVPGTKHRIDEIYWGDDGIRRQWVRVKGNNGWPLVTAASRIRAILTAPYCLSVRALVGHINKDNCPNMSAAAGTLWFKGMDTHVRPNSASTLYDALLYIAHNPAGWQSETVAELQKYKIVKEEVEDSGEKVPTGSWVPDTGTDTVEIPPVEIEADFYEVDALLT